MQAKYLPSITNMTIHLKKKVPIVYIIVTFTVTKYKMKSQNLSSARQSVCVNSAWSNGDISNTQTYIVSYLNEWPVKGWLDQLTSEI